ncbi:MULTISPECIES: type VII secretion target [unclassified Saccharothrix]|uniref:type VII secretion target n=1 Tax=unclassified Saccharothrix TaxID=2593673 RepID=UPI00307E86DC
MTDLSVALDAMRSDATAWETAADRLDAPSAAIGGLALTGADLSLWAVDRGLDRTYEEARTALDDMLGQAARAFRDLGAALRSAADTYEREEEANLHTLNKIVR